MVSSDPSVSAQGRRAEAVASGLYSLKWLPLRSRLDGFPRRHKMKNGCPSSAVVCYGERITP